MNILGSDNSTTRKQLIFMIITVFSSFLLIFVLNQLFPLYADDWEYTYIYGTENIKIENIADIFISQYNHYMHWGGRSVVHFIAQFILMFHFDFICIINSLAYVVFIYAIYRIANQGNKLSPLLFLLFTFFLWLFQPAFFAAVIWKTGSANYLWGTLIIVIFIYPYYSLYRTRRAKNNISYTFLMFFGGIIAGWTNENMGVALIFYIIVSIGLFRYEKINIPKWVYAGLIGAIIGCIIMLIAPGNYIRLEAIKEIWAEENISRYDAFQALLKSLWRYFRRYMLPLLGIYAVLLFLHYKYAKDLEKKNLVIRGSLLFISSSIVATLAMLASPSFPERALFGIITFFLIACGIIYSNISWNNVYLKRIGIILFIFIAGLYGYRYYRAYSVLKPVSGLWNERERYIQIEKSKGVDTIVFYKQFDIKSKFFIHDLSDDPEFWENKLYAKYYGLKSVKVLNKEK